MVFFEFWYIAQTQTLRESAVQRRLEETGLQSYLPRIQVADRPAPLFPGYLMVQPVPEWYAVRWTPGVVRLLMDGERPARLPDRVVAELRQRERNGLIRLPKKPNPLKAGQRVQITRGTFEGRV